LKLPAALAGGQVYAVAGTNTKRRALEPQPGAMIAKRYEIDRLLARGGVGVVYVAHDKTNGREVVVKVLASHLTGETEARARFDREVERLSSIRHANIVEVLDHGYENGAPFLVMEYITGEPLLAFLNRKGRLTIAEFVPIAAQILKALGSAHEKGLMHRDIKPGNIMLTVRKGRANYIKLLDFGMAKLIEGERDITSEQILGTATYMAPEQVRGEQLTARVDVYACGLLFYRMLSGQLPFVADNNAALLYKQVHEVPAPLASVMPEGHEAPPELLELIDLCLAKDPQERPADATELTHALVGCVPSHLFRLPLADGADPNTAMSSTTAAVQEVSASMSGAAVREVSTGSHKRPRRRTVGITPAFGTPALGITATQPGLKSSGSADAFDITAQSERSTPWLLYVLGAIAVAAAIGFAVMRGSGVGGPESTAPVIDERRVAAQLDQVDALILSGEFDRARKELDALGPALDLPKFSSRAGQQRRRIAVLVGLEVARTTEQRGEMAAAEKAYRDVLVLDSSNAEARNGLARTVAATATPEPGPDPTPKTRPKPHGTKKTDKPETKTETKAATKAEDSGLLIPGKKKDDAIFLPTGK
jgi:serine/threonine protein kinase